MITCPHCAHEFEVMVPDGTLSPRELTVFKILARAAPRAVSNMALVERVFGNAELEWPEKNIHVVVFKIRRKLKRVGANVSIVTQWGEGYRLA